MLGELQPDAGSFDMPTQLVVAHVAQEMAAHDSARRRVRHGRRRRAARDRSSDGRGRSYAMPVLRLGELHARYAALGGYDARSRAGRLHARSRVLAPADGTRPSRRSPAAGACG